MALLFTTDPALDDYVELVDDKRLQPAENVTPLIHDEVVERWGAEVVEPLEQVSRLLSTEELRTLNGANAAEPDSADVAAIAAEWLRCGGRDVTTSERPVIDERVDPARRGSYVPPSAHRTRLRRRPDRRCAAAAEEDRRLRQGMAHRARGAHDLGVRHPRLTASASRHRRGRCGHPSRHRQNAHRLAERAVPWDRSGGHRLDDVLRGRSCCSSGWSSSSAGGTSSRSSPA